MSLLTLRFARFVFTFAIAVSCLFNYSTVSAADSDVIQLEEHWELQVGGADPERSAPQVTMVMSPRSNLDGTFFVFTLNHCTDPDFAPGGFQLQRWLGEECVASVYGSQVSPISSEAETITWVQRITLDDGVLKFQVLNGQSDSWGNFGGENFALSVNTQLSKLNGYKPLISTEQSGIGYAGNRVSSLVLQKIRWTTADGEVHEMSAPIDIALNLEE